MEDCVSGRLSTPAVDHGRVVGAAVGQNSFVQSAAVAEVDRTGRSIAGVAVLENLATFNSKVLISSFKLSKYSISIYKI